MSIWSPFALRLDTSFISSAVGQYRCVECQGDAEARGRLFRGVEDEDDIDDRRGDEG